jgi:hypothetical protein
MLLPIRSAIPQAGAPGGRLGGSSVSIGNPFVTVSESVRVVITLPARTI